MELQASTPFNVSELRRKPADDYRSIYSNDSSMAMGFFDVSLTFGQVAFQSTFESGADAKSPFILEKATVTMSWEHLKQLHLAIGGMLAQYESVHKSKIRTPDVPGPLFPPGTGPLAIGS